MANETVTFDLATVLSEMRADIKQIQTTQTTILLNQTRLEGKIDTLETRLEGKIDALETKLEGKIDALETKFDGEIKAVKSDIATIKDTQSKQIWALIGVLATGLVGALIINSWRFWSNV